MQLKAEAFGDVIVSEMIHAQHPRERMVTWALIHTIARKADRLVATADDLPPTERHAEHCPEVVDRCAMLVMRLDEVGANAGCGAISEQQCAEAIDGAVPVMYYLVGRPNGMHFRGRLREWQQLENMAKLLRRRLQFPDAISCAECLTPLDVDGSCITCTHRAQQRA